MINREVNHFLEICTLATINIIVADKMWGGFAPPPRKVEGQLPPMFSAPDF